MIKHIVMFQLQPFATPTQKSAKITEIKSALEGLPQKVEVINHLEVGINCNPDEQYDIVLVTTFNNMDDLNTYIKHPDHIAVGTILRQVLEKRACVDFEF